MQTLTKRNRIREENKSIGKNQPNQKTMDKSPLNIKLDTELSQLLKRCSAIEKRTVSDIVNSLIQPYLVKYRFDSLEEWENAREMMEMEKLMTDFDKNDNFDPNHIPFDTQIIGLRRKLDDLDREIKNSGASTPSTELQKLRFSLVEELSFAETEALKKQRHTRTEHSETWKKTCTEIPLK